MKGTTLLIIGLIFSWGTTAQNFNHFYGNMHAHSGFSDGNKDSLTSGLFTPFQDFMYAKESQHIDFYGISEHNHAAAGMDSKANYYAGVSQAKQATIEDTFVALYGMEWGIISQGGHVLIYGYDSLIGWENNLYDEYVQPNDFSSLWETINSKPNAFAYFAHPQNSDYDSLFLLPVNPIADQAVIGMAFRSGPAFSTNVSYSNPTSSSYWTRYTDALKRGYHLGVGLDHDTHYSVFGRSQQGRMGLMMPILTQEDVLFNMRKMRMYSTDDWNFHVTFELNEQVMGSVLTQAGNPTLYIDGIDYDLSETVSNIFVYYGVPGSGQQATLLTQINQSPTLTFTHDVADGATFYYYARIIQTDGDEIFTSPIWYTRSDSQTEPAPLAHFTPPNELCTGVPFTLEPDGMGNASEFHWTFSEEINPNYSNEANPTLTCSTPGTYHATLYLENATGSHFYTQNITVESCASLMEWTLDFKIFPNPADQSITIERVNGDGPCDKIIFYDGLGRCVKSLTPTEMQNAKIDVSDLNPGLYKIILHCGSTSISKSIAIQH